MKTGISLLCDKLESAGFECSVEKPVSSSSDSKHVLKITRSDGKSITQTLNQLAYMYGTLTFYHLEPEDAIDNLLSVIQANFNVINNNLDGTDK